MSGTVIRIANVARELNVGISTIAEHLNTKGFEVDAKPTTKLTEEMYNVLLADFRQEKAMKEESTQINLGGTKKEEKEVEKDVTIEDKPVKKKDQGEVLIKNLGTHKKGEEEDPAKKEAEKLEGPTVVGKIDLSTINQKTRPEKKKEEPKEKEEPKVKKEKPAKVEEKKIEKKEKPKAEEVKEEKLEKRKIEKLKGTTVVGKIDLPEKKTRQPVASSSFTPGDKKKRKRKVFVKTDESKPQERRGSFKGRDNKGKPGQPQSQEISEKDGRRKVKSYFS